MYVSEVFSRPRKRKWNTQIRLSGVLLCFLLFFVCFFAARRSRSGISWTILSFSRKPYFVTDPLQLLKRISSSFILVFSSAYHQKKFLSCPYDLLADQKRWFLVAFSSFILVFSSVYHWKKFVS